MIKVTARVHPVLPYLEFHACDSCNLNCRACSHFSPLFAGAPLPDPDDLFLSLRRISALFLRVETVRILGGEPLLNPELPRILSETRRILPQSRLSVVTNGLLLERWGKQLAEPMARQNIQLAVTDYGLEEESLRRGIRYFADAGVEITVSPRVHYFHLYLTREPQEDSYRQCQISSCTFLRNQKLYPCALSALVGQYNRRFGEHFPEEPGIDLESAADGREVLARLAEPGALCSGCSDSGQLTRWAPAGLMCAGDWLQETSK